ncbi:translation initiation factor 2, partial [Candidatus Endoriftia persephone str. Guaymas]|nr:translation initiation factor 2 [Candidatus Endoriftia persephone str. Guaymas]
MGDETQASAASSSEPVSDQQLVRAVTSFEAIILSQIEVKKHLVDRLNYSIRTGVIILGLIAV